MSAHPAYLIHDSRRWRVLEEDYEDGRRMFHLELRIPGGKTTRLWAWEDDCKPWARPQGHRRVVGLKDHRGSPVVMDIQQDDRGETLVKLRHKGRSHAYRTTLEGIFDLAARAEAQRIALERAWKKRTARGK